MALRIHSLCPLKTPAKYFFEALCMYSLMFLMSVSMIEPLGSRLNEPNVSQVNNMLFSIRWVVMVSGQWSHGVWMNLRVLPPRLMVRLSLLVRMVLGSVW